MKINREHRTLTKKTVVFQFMLTLLILDAGYFMPNRYTFGHRGRMLNTLWPTLMNKGSKRQTGINSMKINREHCTLTKKAVVLKFVLTLIILDAGVFMPNRYTLVIGEDKLELIL